ncbi:hypothetical protein AGOR_G00135000 [Albula goreensis]|uniref:TNFR-Cys domain-containing protein n=1 Tax=Albula goreensis TaxID=1534307 RepID=A0A8T3D8F6_9TELE|nr:hypothetical protein AGOR_G00135000 [Albula goreensis]
MWHSDFKVTVTISLVIIYCSLSHSCGHEEYEIDGKCCTMCKPGTHVYKHCTERNTTSCIQCTGKTFIDEPNGLPKCRPCSVCDSGLGLNTNTECTFSSDTLCGILDQHFCTEQSKKGLHHENWHIYTWKKSAHNSGMLIQE